MESRLFQHAPETPLKVPQTSFLMAMAPVWPRFWTISAQKWHRKWLPVEKRLTLCQQKSYALPTTFRWHSMSTQPLGPTQIRIKIAFMGHARITQPLGNKCATTALFPVKAIRLHSARRSRNTQTIYLRDRTKMAPHSIYMHAQARACVSSWALWRRDNTITYKPLC